MQMWYWFFYFLKREPKRTINDYFTELHELKERLQEAELRITKLRTLQRLHERNR